MIQNDKCVQCVYLMNASKYGKFVNIKMNV